MILFKHLRIVFAACLLALGVIFNLPNGLQAYFLADARGNRLNNAPIAIVADRNNPDDPIIHSGRSCMSCHYEGMRSLRDDVRPAVNRLNLQEVDRIRVLALYAEQDTIDKTTGRDSGRFQTALEKTGASASLNATTEPISALSRKFRAELSVIEAAAEAGLEPDEFQSRLNFSALLASLGFGQLLVSGGGIKRDVWDRQFADVVRELRLGDYIPPASASAQVSSAGQSRAAAVGVPQTIAPRDVEAVAPSDALRFARRIFIMTRTVHFNPDDLARQLLKKPEFAQMGLSVTKERNAADLVIQVDRLILSTDFPYVVVEARTGSVVTRGQVNSLFGTVPAKIANMFLKQINEARASTVSNR